MTANNALTNYEFACPVCIPVVDEDGNNVNKYFIVLINHIFVIPHTLLVSHI